MGVVPGIKPFVNNFTPDPFKLLVVLMDTLFLALSTRRSRARFGA